MNKPDKIKRSDIILETEEDKPIAPEGSYNTEMELTKSKIKQDEAQKGFELHLKNNSFILLSACIVVIVLLYILDAVFSANHLKNSDMLERVFDFFKMFATMLLGHLFASKAPNNHE